MTDQEMLQAMRQILKEELNPIKTDIAELKESVEEVRDSTNYMATWIENVETKLEVHKLTGKG